MCTRWQSYPTSQYPKITRGIWQIWRNNETKLYAADKVILFHSIIKTRRMQQKWWNDETKQYAMWQSNSTSQYLNKVEKYKNRDWTINQICILGDKVKEAYRLFSLFIIVNFHSYSSCVFDFIFRKSFSDKFILRSKWYSYVIYDFVKLFKGYINDIFLSTNLKPANTYDKI